MVRPQSILQNVKRIINTIPFLVRFFIFPAVVESVADVVGQHRWVVPFFDAIFYLTPEDNRDATFSVLLVFREGINTMHPLNISVTSEMEEHAVFLRKVKSYALFSV